MRRTPYESAAFPTSHSATDLAESNNVCRSKPNLRLRNSSFTHKDTVLDVSSYKLSEEELGTLKFGLTFSIKPNVTFSQNLNSIAKVLKDISQTRAKAIKCNQQRLATSLTTTQPRSQGPLSTSRSRERTLGTRLRTSLSVIK